MPMASNHALLETLEERLMMELSRNSMKIRAQQREEELKRETMLLEERVKMIHSTAQEILTVTESAMKAMQQNMMGDMTRMGTEMMEKLQLQHTQLSRELETLAAKQQQGSLMQEMAMMEENTNEMRNAPPRNTLMASVKLMTDEPLMSENGRYKAMLLRDGDMVIVDLNKLGRVVKNVGSAGQSLGPEAYLMLMPEGNLMIKTGDEAIDFWSTAKDPEGDRYDHILKLENDGQLVVFNVMNRRVWTSGFV
jgi:hypothetical protein